MGEFRTQTTTHTTSTGMGMHRGMSSPGWGWGAAHSTTRIQESQYLQGTLVVEVFDVEDKKLIWQAIGKKTVSEDPKKRNRTSRNSYTR